jgi:cell division protein FtsL
MIMDPSTTDQLASGIGGILIIVAFVLAVEWVFLPFAIFGIKTRLESIRDGIEKTNKLLDALVQQSKSTSSE